MPQQAYGAKLWSSAAGSVYIQTGTANAREIQPPQMTKAVARGDTLEATDHARVKLSSWIDGGQATFQVEYSFATWNALLAIFTNNQAGGYYWRVEDAKAAGQSTTGDYHNFRGILAALSKAPLNTEDDDTCLINGTIEVTGLPTVVTGA